MTVPGKKIKLDLSTSRALRAKPFFPSLGIIMVERLGRRKFLLFGAIWMVITSIVFPESKGILTLLFLQSFCQLVVGAVAEAKGQTSAVAGQVLVAFTLLFIAGVSYHLELPSFRTILTIFDVYSLPYVDSVDTFFSTLV